MRVRIPADAFPSQEDVESAPEETRGERAGAGRRERRGDQEQGRRSEGAERDPPDPRILTPDPAPSALPGVPRPEEDPGPGRRLWALRHRAVVSGGSGGGTRASIPQPSCLASSCMAEPRGVVAKPRWSIEPGGRTARGEGGPGRPPGVRWLGRGAEDPSAPHQPLPGLSPHFSCRCRSLAAGGPT